MLSVSCTKPSPVQSLSDCKPFLMAFLWRIASCCLLTKSVWVVKYSSDDLHAIHIQIINKRIPLLVITLYSSNGKGQVLAKLEETTEADLIRRKFRTQTKYLRATDLVNFELRTKYG